MSTLNLPPQYDKYDKYKRVETSEGGEDAADENNDNPRASKKLHDREDDEEMFSPDLKPPSEPFISTLTQTTPSVLCSWLFEIFCMAMAVFSLVTIITLLLSTNHKQTSEWKFVNLTTVVAILSTLGRMSLAAAVGNIIAQAKWTRVWRQGNGEGYDEGQPLKDMDVYDQASRGALLGSAKIFSSGRGSTKVYLSVLVMILSTAMASFAQQAVQTVSCASPSNQQVATLPNSQMLGHVGMKEKSVGMWWKSGVSYATKANIISSFADPLGAESEIHATCGDGTCTFPTFRDDKGREITHRSIGVCSRCIDTSTLVTYNEDIFGEEFGPKTMLSGVSGDLKASLRTWSLPTGQNVSYKVTNRWQEVSEALGRGDDPRFFAETEYAFLSVRGTSSFQWARNASSDDDFFAASEYAFANVSVMGLQDSTLKSQREPSMLSDKAFATSCTLYPCVKSYLASVKDGILVEAPVATELLTRYSDIIPIQEEDDTEELYRGKWGRLALSDMLAVASPCVVDGQAYTTNNVSDAPGAITLSRLRYENGRNTSEAVNGTHASNPILVDPGLVNITAPPECIYGVGSYYWLASFRLYLGRSMSATCGKWAETKRLDLPVCIQSYDVYLSEQYNFRDLFWFEPLADISNRTTYEVSKWLEGATDSMTRRFRLSKEVYGYDNVWDNRLHTVNGTVGHTTTCFDVDWYWLIFPISLTVSGLVVLLWTLFTHGVERIWKSSILPFVYHQERFMPVNDHERAARFYETKKRKDWAPLLNLRSMEKDAKDYRVIFDGESTERVLHHTVRYE